jgi:outer membrane receptor protein involved in Fe transport
MTRTKQTLRHVALMTSAVAALVIGTLPAAAQNRPINVPAQSASTAISVLAKQAGVQILLTGRAADGVKTHAARGNLSVERALAVMLSGTGLYARKTGAQTYTILSSRNGDSAGEVEAGSAAADTESAEIIVTAQLRQQSLSEVPMSIVALSGEELEKRNVSTLLDIIREAPGVAIQDQGVGQRRIFMRGVGNVFGTSSLVGLYLDDAPVTGIQDGEIDLRPYDLERVEVLRGPQGTLYGEGSTAGTLRFITNKPDLSDIGASGKYTASFTRDGGMNNEFLGTLNLPIVGDTLGIRLSGLVQDISGWIDQPLQSRKDINGQKMIDLRLIALYRPTTDLSVRLTGILHRNDAGAQNTVSNEQGEFTQALGQTTTPESHDDYEFGNATITYQLGTVQLLSSTSRLSVDKQLYNQGSSLLIAPTTRLGVYGDRLRSAKVFSQELRASSTSGGFTWLVGGFYRQARSRLDLMLQAGFGTPLFPIETVTIQQTRAWSVFGTISYALSPELEIGAGLRYFRDRRKTDDGVTLQRGTFKSLSPRLYARYSPVEDINLYANVAKGFRSGGFNTSGLPDYDPEKAWTYEIGLKHGQRGNGFAAEMSIFQTDYKNVQILSINPATFGSEFSNAGAARIRGIEGSFSARIAGDWEAGASASYSPSKFVSIFPNSTHAVDDRLDFVPKYNVNMWTAYTFNLGDENQAYARLDYSIQGPSTYRNRTIGDFFLGRSDIIRILNASVQTDLGPWRFEIFASNLLNERGFIDPTIIEGYATQLRPRTLGISFSRTF